MTNPTDFIDSPDFLCITGSRLYGCERYGTDGEIVSDLDLRGFVLPTLDHLIGIKTFKEGTREGDHKVYSLLNFINMLIKGNAQALECLFAPESHIQIITDVGRSILSNRDLFIGKHYYKSITGFSYSEWNKVIGVKHVPVKREVDETTVLDAFRNKFKHLPKDKWDDILTIAYSEHERQVVDAKSDVGEKRRAEYARYGYCATSAHHAIRLLYQCEELLQDGKMTFPRPEKQLLRTIKTGAMPLKDVQEVYEDIRQRVDVAYAKSTIPERVDSNKAMALYKEIAVEALCEKMLSSD